MNSFFFWLPRLLAICAIGFISMFALDSFSPDLTIPEQIVDLLRHLIPSFVLLAFLFIAWRWELAGGIIFMVTAIVLMPFVFNLNYTRNHFSVLQSLAVLAIINLPFVIVGALFVYSHFRRRRIF